MVESREKKRQVKCNAVNVKLDNCLGLKMQFVTAIKRARTYENITLPLFFFLSVVYRRKVVIASARTSIHFVSVSSARRLHIQFRCQCRTD